MIVFGNPKMLWLLLIVLPITLMGWWGWKVKKNIDKIARFQLDLGRMKRSQAKKYLLIGAMLTLAIVALARPQTAIPYIQEGISETKTGQIILLVDVSESMAARTSLESLSRLERTKKILYRIIDAFPGAEISLYAFTSEAWSLTPFVKKEDFHYLRSSIKNTLDILCVPGRGSDLGRAISGVLYKFSNQTQPRIILLFSDGEYFGADRGISPQQRKTLEKSLQKVREKKIRLIPVGIGEIKGAPIPFFDKEGNFIGYGLHKGETYISYLDELLLQAIASRANSQYFSENDLLPLIGYIRESLVTVSIPETEPETEKPEYEYRDVNSYLFLVPIAVLFVAFVRYYFKK